MPRGDRTGPDGLGAMTGRRMGYCAGYDSPGFTKGVPRGRAGYGYGRGFGYGRGYGRGFGFGRGYGRGYGYASDYYPATNPDYANISEKTMLENEAKVLQEQLNSLEKRLAEIEKKESE